jgi:hypothetical protein
MTTSNLESLKSKIESLPDEEFFRLRQWFAEKEWERWEGQLQADEAEGRLAFLLDEANQALSQHTVRDL